MTLNREMVIDKIEVVENGAIQVRRAQYITENGVRIAGPQYHRAAYEPGQDVSNEAPVVQRIAAVVWTADVIAAHRAAVDAANAADL